MVGGVPNVGKSTIINSLRQRETELGHTKKSGARTGGVPCITKSINQRFNLVKIVLVVETGFSLNSFPHNSQPYKIHAPLSKIINIKLVK